MIDSIVANVELDETVGTETYEAPQQLGSISKAQGLALLTRLVTDDAFRARFERAPIAALSEIGVPMAQIVMLRDACITPRTLAAQDVLLATRQRLITDVDHSALAFVIPTLKY